MDNAVYIVFSATPTKMGRIIRGATRNRYNHVSLSLSRDIHKMFTFARRHRTVPLAGGFVAESILRYQSFAGTARVKVCRVPVDEPRLTYLHNYMDQLWTRREEYLYNTPAALFSLVHLRPAISKAYTCVTFVQELLGRYGLAGVTERDGPTVRALEGRLAPYVIYEGPAPEPDTADWGEDTYPQEVTTRRAVYTTARHFGRLARRFAAALLILIW